MLKTLAIIHIVAFQEPNGSQGIGIQAETEGVRVAEVIGLIEMAKIQYLTEHALGVPPEIKAMMDDAADMAVGDFNHG